jgi:hypothetical protein
VNQIVITAFELFAQKNSRTNLDIHTSVVVLCHTRNGNFEHTGTGTVDLIVMKLSSYPVHF